MGTTAEPIPDTTSATNRTPFDSEDAAAASPAAASIVPAKIDAPCSDPVDGHARADQREPGAEQPCGEHGAELGQAQPVVVAQLRARSPGGRS